MKMTSGYPMLTNMMMKLVSSFLAAGLALAALAGCGEGERLELQIVGEIPDLPVRDMIVRGDVLYGTTADDALIIVDISAPARPEVVGRLDAPVGWRYTSSLAVQGEFAYVPNQRDFVVAVDISDPTQPVEVGRYESAGMYIYDVTIRDQYLYLVGQRRLVIVDISVPAAPVQVSELSTFGGAHGITLSGDLAYIADTYAGLYIADISDPLAPRHVGNTGEPYGASRTVIRGARAYVLLTDLDAGLAVVDISDPARPAMTTFTSVEFAESFALGDDDVAYLGRLSNLTMLDLGDPDSPRRIGEFAFNDLETAVASVTISGDHIYASVVRQRENFGKDRFLVLTRAE